jgi:hypothetical protein
MGLLRSSVSVVVSVCVLDSALFWAVIIRSATASATPENSGKEYMRGTAVVIACCVWRL